MKLTIKLTDEQLTGLKNALTMSTEEYKRATSFQNDHKNDLAYNIMCARYYLDLSTRERECCHDYDWSKSRSWDDVIDPQREPSFMP